MKHLHFHFLSAALVFILTGCSNPADDVAAAKVSAPANASEATELGSEEPGSARLLVFGPETSKIEFIGSKVTGSHTGGFSKFEGELHLGNDGQPLSNGRVVIDMTSVWSDNERLTGHLKNADFFEVERFPTSTFVLTGISGQGSSATLAGNLTLHGVTKQISFPAKLRVSEGMVELESEFSIDRFDFDIKYPGRADDLIRKEVVLKFSLRAIPPGTVAL
jgi:polyisoprenoid-binding protein YceI